MIPVLINDFLYFRAAKNIAKAERDDASGNKSQMLYSLEFITEMFIQLAHATPFLTLQWCYILKVPFIYYVSSCRVVE